MRVPVAGVVAALILAGCTGGKHFVRPYAGALDLGTTTEQEVRQRMGEPSRTGTALRNGEAVTTLAYGYALAVPYVDDVKTRAMGFYFLNGALAVYEYTSSFDGDKTRVGCGADPSGGPADRARNSVAPWSFGESRPIARAEGVNNPSPHPDLEKATARTPSRRPSVALARHPDSDGTDAAPGVEP